LTPGLPIGHNLCFRCPNGWCKPILDIYTSIDFQCYKKRFKARNFDPYNCVMKIWESIRDSNFQHGSPLGSVRVHSLTLFALPRACEVTPGSPSWPATLPHLALVASPRLGLRHLRCYFNHIKGINNSLAFLVVLLSFLLFNFFYYVLIQCFSPQFFWIFNGCYYMWLLFTNGFLPLVRKLDKDNKFVKDKVAWIVGFSLLALKL
jgi:hypothetical protein